MPRSASSTVIGGSSSSGSGSSSSRDSLVCEIYGCPRSGAFAVHGRSPKGLGISGLTDVAEHLRGGGASMSESIFTLEALGFSSMQALNEEIGHRLVLCIAQALPVLVSSMSAMCRSSVCLESAFKTGELCHVQQSLLSDTNTGECSYLQDMMGALEQLAGKLEVRFSGSSSGVLPVTLGDGGRIVLNLSPSLIPDDLLLSASCTKEEFVSQSYSFVPIVFSQGINAMQSLGFVIRKKPELVQDIINRKSLTRLNDYAVKAGRSGGEALAALNRHYQAGGKRSAKDVESFWLIRTACKEVGIGRAVNCKSGKDRTALELSISLTQETIAAGLASPDGYEALRGNLNRGLSYAMTGQNNGQPNAYAFSEMELLTFPKGWAPNWKLCGKVNT
ncbi:MAG: hypothetical protein WDW38_001009 [Sanguina aurantia]